MHLCPCRLQGTNAYMLREHLEFIHHQWLRCCSLFYSEPLSFIAAKTSDLKSMLAICLSFQVTLDDHGSKIVDFKIVWSSSPDSLKYNSYFSLPELIEFATEVPGQNAYAYFYPPSNPIYQASEEEKPPLLLKSHGMLRLFTSY